MPVPSNNYTELSKIVDKLISPPGHGLRNQNWNVHKDDQKIVYTTNFRHEEYGRLVYILAADSQHNIWLKIIQNTRTVKNKELLNVPLSWLPSHWRDDIQEVMVTCLFTLPTVIQTPDSEPGTSLAVISTSDAVVIQ